MNLHGIVSPIIAAVNPQIPAEVKISNGFTVAAGGKRVPIYFDPFIVPAQVQAMSFGDLRQVDALNLNGTRRGIYLYGKFDGVVRSRIKGGDIITITGGANRGVWLVAMVLEQWPDWCKVAVTLQNEQP